MKARDWEAHHALLHKHDSAQFVPLTPRVLREHTPVLQRFAPNINHNTDRRDLVAGIVGVAALIAIAAIRWLV